MKIIHFYLSIRSNLIYRFSDMKKEIYTITLKNESAFKRAIEILNNEGLDYIANFKYINDNEIPNMEQKQENDFIKAFLKFVDLSAIQKQRNYKVSPALSLFNVMPKTALMKHLRLRLSFKQDIRGIKIALDETIKRMIKAEMIVEIDKEKAFTQYATTSTIYMLWEHSHSIGTKQEKLNSFLNTLKEIDTKKQESDTRLIPAFDATLVQPIFNDSIQDQQNRQRF